MNPQDFLKKPVNGCDDKSATVAVVAGTVTDLVSFNTKTGKKAWVVGICTNTAGSPDDVTYFATADGRPIGEYGKFTVSPADPQLYSFLPFPLEVGENSILKVQALCATVAANVTGRVIVFYTDP